MDNTIYLEKCIFTELYIVWTEILQVNYDQSEVENETANKVFLPTFTVFFAPSLTILDHFEPTHEIVVLIAMADPKGVRLNPTTRPRF